MQPGSLLLLIGFRLALAMHELPYKNQLTTRILHFHYQKFILGMDKL